MHLILSRLETTKVPWRLLQCSLKGKYSTRWQALETTARLDPVNNESTRLSSVLHSFVVWADCAPALASLLQKKSSVKFYSDRLELSSTALHVLVNAWFGLQKALLTLRNFF